MPRTISPIIGKLPRNLDISNDRRTFSSGLGDAEGVAGLEGDGLGDLLTGVGVGVRVADLEGDVLLGTTPTLTIDTPPLDSRNCIRGQHTTDHAIPLGSAHKLTQHGHKLSRASSHKTAMHHGPIQVTQSVTP